MDLSLTDKLNNRRVLLEVFSWLFPITDFILESNSKILCPFHDDRVHPSAKIYENDGKTVIYCFAERRIYTSYHYVEIIIGDDPLTHLMKYRTDEEIEEAIKLLRFKGKLFANSNKVQESNLIRQEEVLDYIERIYEGSIEKEKWFR